jgi:hypothetical protein
MHGQNVAKECSNDNEICPHAWTSQRFGNPCGLLRTSLFDDGVEPLQAGNQVQAADRDGSAILIRSKAAMKRRIPSVLLTLPVVFEQHSRCKIEFH